MKKKQIKLKIIDIEKLHTITGQNNKRQIAGVVLMKLIYDNIIFSLQNAGGISKYWSELIKRLIKKDDIIVTFYESANKNIFRKNLAINFKKESCLNVKTLRYLPFTMKLPANSVFHSSYYRFSLQKNVVNITTVHDFTYEYFRSGIPKYVHKLQKWFAIKNSDGIICVSENTKKDLMKFYPNIEESKIKVIYNGVGNEFRHLNNSKNFLIDKFEVLKNKKYILYVGDRSNYKNFHLAVDVATELKDYFLVVVGKRFDAKEKVILKNIENRIFLFEGISGEELNILYNNAFCFLYPSTYEGFGIPIIEAMRAGCPVISTNRSSIPEIAGDSAILVKNIELHDFINAIKILEDEKERKKIISKGFEQALKFNWDKCFEETYIFYKTVYDKKVKN